MFYKKIDNDTVILYVKLKPNSNKDAIIGVSQAVEQHKDHFLQYLLISLRAVPHEGEANKYLLKFLSKELSITSKQISLIKGSKAKFKQILIEEEFSAIETKLNSLFLKKIT